MQSKKLFIILFFVMFIFLFSNVAFASIDFTYNDEEVSLPDIPLDDYCNATVRVNPYIIVWSDYWKCYMLAICKDWDSQSSKIYGVSENGMPDKYVQFKNSSGAAGTFYQYFYKNNVWEYAAPTTKFSVDNKPEMIAVSTVDIESSSGGTFFQVTSLTALGEIVKEANLQTTLLQIVKILPMILVLVVSFLGLHKCWRLLSMLLHKA